MSSIRHDRIADELAGAVVGDAPAAVGLDHLDALRAVEVLADAAARRVARAPPARVDRRVLEQQQHVRQLAGLPALADAGLHRHRLGVGHAAQLAHPQLGGGDSCSGPTAHLSSAQPSARPNPRHPLGPRPFGLVRDRARRRRQSVRAAGACRSSRMRARKPAASAP